MSAANNNTSLLALDIGSSSVRASLYDYNSDLIPRSGVKIEWSFATTRGGGSVMDPTAALRTVFAAVDAVLVKTKRPISHVAMCSFWHSLMGVDEGGRPTTKLLGWADTRSREYSAVLKNCFDETAMHNRTGAHFHSSFWPAKLLWLRKASPAAFERTAKWLSFSDYIALKLFGSTHTSVSMASGTGIFDQRECDWDSPLIRYLNIRREQLPVIAEARMKLCATSARRWPRLKDAEWFPAIGDGAADHIGSSGIGKGKVSLMIGTSAAMRVAYKGGPPGEVPNGLWSYRIDKDRVIVGGALSDGGNLYHKFKTELKVAKNAEARMRLPSEPVNGLTVLPFFFGERSTGYREDARGAIVGTNPDIDASDLLQAAMEGIAFRLAEVCDRLKGLGRIKTVVVSGGALRDSAVWKQIIADVLGRDLTLSSSEESASRGAVLLALESLGKIRNIDRFPEAEHDTLAYHRGRHSLYKKARKQHQAAYEQQ